VIGYHDVCAIGAHRNVIDGVALEFDGDSMLWNPTDAQLAALTANALRRARFRRIERVEVVPPTPAAPESPEPTEEAE
jgi:hypothetical protein